MNESEFQAVADRVLDRIEAALEASGADLDFERPGSGILQIECVDGSQIIINRHVANREIWVAARAGGFHFRSSDGVWRDTRDERELMEKLAELILAQSGETIRF